MSDHDKLTLAIESAIGGGSLALLSDGQVFARWSGSSSVKRSDELLANIDDLLKANRVRPGDLQLIAVSAGPGSFTGIRIGIATALGLKTGLRVEMASVSALKAMASVQQDGQQIIIAVPVGRDAVCVQAFNKLGANIVELDQPGTIRQNDLGKGPANGTLVVHETLFRALSLTNAVNFGTDIASAIGQYALAGPATIAEPLFVRKSF